MPATKSVARSTWCRISRRAVSAGSEGIDRLGGGRRADIGLEAVATDDVDGAIEEAGDVVLQLRVVEDGDARLGLDLDRDVDVAFGPSVAASERAEKGRPAHAAGAQVAFMPAQDRDGVLRLR